mgnify:CR=1 FL=1
MQEQIIKIILIKKATQITKQTLATIELYKIHDYVFYKKQYSLLEKLRKLRTFVKIINY